MSVLKYAKAIVGLVLALATAAVSYFPSDRNVQLYGGAALAVLTAVGVALTKNSPANDVAVLTAIEGTGIIPSKYDEVLLKLIAIIEAHVTPPKPAPAVAAQTPLLAFPPPAPPADPPAAAPADSLAAALALLNTPPADITPAA